MSIETFYQNPIDIVEEVIHHKNWNFSRCHDHELVADIYTSMSQYRLYFNWSENLKSINFTVTFDLKFSQSKYSNIYELLAKINENLWLGHFDITSKSGIIAYRQTFFLPNQNDMLFKQLDDLVDISVYECEKYYPAFNNLFFEDTSAKDALELCSLNVIGRA